VLRSLLAAAVVVLIAAAPASAANPWLDNRVLNMAHQGGEDELPSNTMYAFRAALRQGGSQMLELDVSSTSDGELVVMHDWTVDRTTNGSGYLTDLTLAQVRQLDAAYNFVPGRNAVPGLPARRYPFRGVRTGDKAPPRGFRRTDFAVPTLREVLRRFPHTPLNIEIKGRDDDPAQFLRNAELLAALLKDTPRRDLIVVSFNQQAVDRFHELLPQIPVAPGVEGIARFLLGGESPGAGVVALQIPITFELGGQTLQVTTPESVQRAHAAGFAVHVWLSNDEESRRVYDRLLDMCVDGIMAARPHALWRRLVQRQVVGTVPGGTDPCAVRAARATVEGRTIAVGLRRRGLGPQAHAGTVVVRARGRLLGREAFSLDAGAEAGGVTVALTRFGRRLLDGGERVRAVVSVRTRGARGAPVRSSFRLGR
jgi:glycerophosphoryl diester phosphodiesterase